MINTYTIKEDHVVEISNKEIEKDKFVWIRMLDPTHIEIVETAEITGFPHEEFVEFTEEEERPRFQQEEDYLFIIYRLPHYEKDTITTIPIAILLRENLIITIEKKPIRSVKFIQSLIEKSKAQFIFRKDPAFLLYYLFDKIDDEFLYITNKISSEVKVTEFGQKQDTESLETLYRLNNTLIFIHQAMIANIEVLNHLRKLHFKHFGKMTRGKFDELYYDGLQILDTTRVQRDLMTSMFNFQSSLASQNLNVIMKRITSVGFLVLLPTLLSGIYGMNFQHMPLTDHVYGFWFVLAIMFGITFGFFLLLKKYDWL